MSLTSAATVERHKSELREYLDKLNLTDEQKLEVSHRVAKLAASAVRDDRVYRKPYDSLAKLCDVVFNGRPA